MNTGGPILTTTFPLGRLCITPAALDALSRRGLIPAVYLARHAMGDFGDLDEEDLARNTQALTNGARVFSAYDLTPCGDDPVTKVWVITEADRHVTTVLLPTDY